MIGLVGFDGCCIKLHRKHAFRAGCFKSESGAANACE
jgi:hypothetical protein